MSKERKNAMLRFKSERAFKSAVDGYFDALKKRAEPDEPFSFPSLGGLLVHLKITKTDWEELSELYPKTAARAKTVLEAYLEQELIRRKSGVSGIIFNLQSVYGWRDRKDGLTPEPMEVVVKVVE